MRKRTAAILVGMVAGIQPFLAQAVTLRTNTDLIVFPSPLVTNYNPGFTYQGGADMAVDKAGNAHIVIAGEANHIGLVEYRRWGHAITNWSAPLIRFEYGDGTNDNSSPVIAIDDADRVHILYYHRMATGTTDNTTPYDLYHVWCTNASGSTPLSSNNWIRPGKITAIPANTKVYSSLISVGSNLLLYARGGVDANGDGNNDIRIDRSDWDGSQWVWSPVGVAIAGSNNAYGGLHTPKMTYDPSNGVVHLAFRDECYNGRRWQAYSMCVQPTNPVSSSWLYPTPHGNINSTWMEGNGHTCILEDGRAVALVFLGQNRDGMGPNATNFTRVRTAGPSGIWGPWTNAFPGDVRNVGSSTSLTTGYGGAVASAPDGAGGVFMISGNNLVMHWDPRTTNWADVFTNLPVSVDNTHVGNLATVPAQFPQLSTLYLFRRDTQRLYVGKYLILRQPHGTVIFVR